MNIMDGQKQHAADLAYLINLAGEGIPEFLWADMAENGESPMDVGARRAARDEGGFSYRHTRICNLHNKLAGMILAYRQPDPYDISDIDDYPGFLKPLIKLEADVPGSWYINALATYEPFRGQGIAQALLQDTERLAKKHRCSLLSIIVASENSKARDLYLHLGFKITDALPVIPIDKHFHGGDWLLMTKAVSR